MKYPAIAKLKTLDLFRERISELEIEIPAEPLTDVSILAQNHRLNGGRVIGNRFCILPMEGWDGTRDGHPTELTKRRWKNFGLSGAKLIWGGEAVAVRADGRANPNQLMLNDKTLPAISGLRELLLETHHAEFGSTEDILVGLQLTHSGRFARPNEKDRLEPRTAYAHPVLDTRFGVKPEQAVLSDDELKRLIDDFIAAAKRSEQAGFDFVDIKHCHGYLGHELLSGFDRAGEFGGDFENRTRFLREVVAGIQAETQNLQLGVRLSIFDFCPFGKGPDGTGVPAVEGTYPFAFGGDGTGQGIDLDETMDFLRLLRSLDIELICTTAGSPYYNPHIQRPASLPPSDGYLPPEDPLVGVARQLDATRRLKEQVPEMFVVGSGYSYLQDWLPNVANEVVRAGWVDSVGLGRMVLSYPELPADVLKGQPMQRKKICRTFSDCTTAPRNGLVSGCYPLDPFYKSMPERRELLQLKKAAAENG